MAQNRGIATGPEGDTLFSQPFFAFTKENELPGLFQRVAGLDDHRLLALVTALIVEDRLDKILRAFCPRYKVLTDQNEFTFSLKIRMLEALAFVPRHLTEAADIIRGIRNEFAHNLERTRLSQLNPKYHRKMDGLLQRVYADQEISETGEDLLWRKFKRLSFVAIVGLDGYVTNCEKLRSTISHSEFVKGLQKEVVDEFEKLIEESRARGPKSVRRSGSQWIIEYDSFNETTDVLPEGVEPPPAEQSA